MTRFDVPLCSWNQNSLVPLAKNAGLYFSTSMSTKQSGWLQNLWIDAGACVHCTNTCPRYQTCTVSSLKQCLIDTFASISQNVINEAVGQWKKQLCASMMQKDITLNTCKLKPALFQSQHATQPALFEPPTVYQEKHVVLRHFHRSYLKTNKVRKSEGTRIVKYGYHFWKTADDGDRKIIKID